MERENQERFVTAKGCSLRWCPIVAAEHPTVPASVELRRLQQFRYLRPALRLGSLRFDVIAARGACIEVIDELRVVERYMTGVKKSINSLMITAIVLRIHDSLCSKR